MSQLEGFQIDLDLLRAFERGLDPRHPERSKIPAYVLGYGEISTVFEIRAAGFEGLALKRLPLFRSLRELEGYKAVYLEYNRLLEEAVGLQLPRHGFATFVDDAGQPIFYIIQERLPAASIGNQAIQRLSPGEVGRLVEQVLREMGKVWDYNLRQRDVQVAVDGQISKLVDR